MKGKAKEVAIKATQRFMQAAAAYLVAAFSAQMAGVDVFDLHTLKSVAGSLVIGAFAAGLSASWNGVIQPMLNKLKGGEGNG